MTDNRPLALQMTPTIFALLVVLAFASLSRCAPADPEVILDALR